MNLYEAIEIICEDYCKYPDVESGNKLADICDKCPMNKCEELRWAGCKDKPTTQTETQNSNLTFEKRTMRDCYNCKKYETEGECIECHYEPKDEPKICDTCRYYNSNIPCGSTPSACKKADKFAEEFVNELKKLKDEPQRDCLTCYHREQCHYLVEDMPWDDCPYQDEPQTERSE